MGGLNGTTARPQEANEQTEARGLLKLSLV